MTAIREQKEEAIKLTVQYQSVHAGHEMQVGKLRLHQEDRRNLAALLKIEVPYTNIIENIQNKCPPTERLGLLTKKDLHNSSSRRLQLREKREEEQITNYFFAE
ncbi:hypothetical protein TNCV_2643751 [Trichonephila clavipes]|nr:hypothetical protein TNCV_2643751 [Trichonephila clavipes]